MVDAKVGPVGITPNIAVLDSDSHVHPFYVGIFSEFIRAYVFREPSRCIVVRENSTNGSFICGLLNKARIVRRNSDLGPGSYIDGGGSSNIANVNSYATLIRTRGIGKALSDLKRKFPVVSRNPRSLILVAGFAGRAPFERSDGGVGSDDKDTGPSRNKIAALIFPLIASGFAFLGLYVLWRVQYRCDVLLPALVLLVSLVGFCYFLALSCEVIANK